MVKKIDIDRLHKVVENYIHPRAAGQTVAMLVEAAQQVDFATERTRVLILGWNYDYSITYLKPAFIEIAKDLEFAPKDHRHGEVRIGLITFVFGSMQDERKLLDHNGPVFRDHYDGDSRVIRRNRL